MVQIEVRRMKLRPAYKDDTLISSNQREIKKKRLRPAFKINLNVQIEGKRKGKKEASTNL